MNIQETGKYTDQIHMSKMGSVTSILGYLTITAHRTSILGIRIRWIGNYIKYALRKLSARYAILYSLLDPT